MSSDSKHRPTELVGGIVGFGKNWSGFASLRRGEGVGEQVSQREFNPLQGTLREKPVNCFKFWSSPSFPTFPGFLSGFGRRIPGFLRFPR